MNKNIDCSKLETICEKVRQDLLLLVSKRVFDIDVEHLQIESGYDTLKNELLSQFDYQSLKCVLELSGFSIEPGTVKAIQYSESALEEPKAILEIDSTLARKGKNGVLIAFIPNDFEKHLKKENMSLKISQPISEDDYIVHAFITRTGIGLGKSKVNSYSFLSSLFKDFPNSEPARILKGCFDDLKTIDSLSKKELYAINKKWYVDMLFKIIKNESYNDLSNKVERIKPYILQSQYCDDIVVSFNTYLDFKADIDNRADISMIDFSSVALGLYKFVEIIFYDLLSKRWDGFNYKNRDGKNDYKDISNRNKTTLGDLNQIFYSTDKEVIKLLNKSDYYSVRKSIYDWIKEDRNDHTHKDVMEAKEDLDKTLSSTINVVDKLIEMFV